MKISQLFLGLVACSTAFAYAQELMVFRVMKVTSKSVLLPMQAIRVV